MNEEQKEAILENNNVLLIAGAGTGKTTTIINKIKYLLDNNIFNENEILVISFTNESVNDIKRKTSNNIDIFTFHKLAICLINNANYHVANDYTLSFIIDEYFNSYAKQNKKTKKLIQRLLLENDLKSLKTLITTFINLYKSNYENISYLFYLFNHNYLLTKDYLRIILEIYIIYDNELKSSGYLDFNDLIIEATNLINNNDIITNYKYIIIDEFQDTSLIRLNLILAIIKQTKAKLFAVGDDYQSIYRFSGCDLNVFLNINKYIKDIKILKLKVNYRNNQDLINIANNFIMKNKTQIKKETICNKDGNKSIKIIFYVDKNKVINNCLKLVNGKALILGRNNKDKENFNVIENDNIKFLTIHKSKGLEADNVILINLENNSLGLPSKINNNKIINKIVKQDYFPYEEERRLFYVALTRTRNNIYLLVPSKKYSVFVKELINNYYNLIEFVNIH